MAKMKIRGLNKLIPKAKIVARQYKMCQVPETPMSLHHPALPYLPVYRQAHPSSSGMEVIPEEEPITSQQNGNSVSEVMEIDPAVPVENEIAESPSLEKKH